MQHSYHIFRLSFTETKILMMYTHEHLLEYFLHSTINLAATLAMKKHSMAVWLAITLISK